jgi:hypothetical protein
MYRVDRLSRELPTSSAQESCMSIIFMRITASLSCGQRVGEWATNQHTFACATIMPPWPTLFNFYLFDCYGMQYWVSTQEFGIFIETPTLLDLFDLQNTT